MQVSGQATLPNGAYCPALDKPDQGLDLIRDACKNAGLQLNENIGVIIDVGADKLFDQVYWKIIVETPVYPRPIGQQTDQCSIV